MANTIKIGNMVLSDEYNGKDVSITDENGSGDSMLMSSDARDSLAKVIEEWFKQNF